MLNAMGWCSKGIPWAERKATALNRPFQEQGATGKTDSSSHLRGARGKVGRRGREQYGPVFSGHPLEELDEELLDAINYAEEAARHGFRWQG